MKIVDGTVAIAGASGRANLFRYFFGVDIEGFWLDAGTKWSRLDFKKFEGWLLGKYKQYDTVCACVRGEFCEDARLFLEELIN